MASKKKTKKTSARELPPEDVVPCQLYLITPPKINDMPTFLRALREALSAAPVACLQIRLKDISGSDVIQAANAIIPVAHEFGTAVVINDDPQIAADTGADGAHIGQSDMDYLSSRKLLGADAIIGVTCHNSRDLAFEAANAGADYVAFGAFFDTPTKDPIARAELELLQWWSQAVEVPCVAIGGITPENCAPLIAAGADFLAVSSSVWNHPAGPGAAVKAFTAQF